MTIYSHSRLGTFENCPRYYWYGYIGKPEIERVDTVEAFLGSRVHEALEELYKRLMGGQMMSQDELLAWYEALWDRNWHDNVHIVSETFTAEDYRQVGRESLKAYYDRHHPFDQSQTLRLEALISFDLDDAGKYRMRGYIDRLAQREDGTYEIHDYKTSRQMPTQGQADKDRQLALYQIGVQGMWNDVGEVDLIWHYVRFGKEIVLRRTPEQIAELKQQCIAVIDDIESRERDEANFPTKKSRLCNWCEYQAICPATRHHVAVAALPPKQFKADAGVSLVDAWVSIRQKRTELQEQADALQAEEEILQEQLIAFAAQQGIESVAGPSHHVDIVQQRVIECPKAGDDNREDFEKAIRQAGIWDDITSLNASSFKALWKKEDLTPAARKKLAPFITDTTQTVAKLKKGGSREE